VAAGIATAALAGAWVVLALLACGAIEYLARSNARPASLGLFAPIAATPAKAGLGALAWTAIKVGALSFGGGFVIVPLMQADAVHAYHWMTNAQFLNAVALGQVTPGPVVRDSQCRRLRRPRPGGRRAGGGRGVRAVVLDRAARRRAV